MSKVQTIVNIILEQQKHLLAPSTYEARKNYLKDLISHADAKGITDPCQELYDSYVVRATTPDLRFQLLYCFLIVKSALYLGYVYANTLGF